MNLLRQTISGVLTLSVFLRGAGMAHADPPQEPIPAVVLPGIEPPAQGRPPPAPRTGDTRPDGITLMVIGTLALAGGVGLSAYGYKQGVSPTMSVCTYCTADIGAEFGGGLLGAAGLTTLIIGIVVYAEAGSEPAKKTSFDLVLPKTPGVAGTAWLRAPVWRDQVKDASGSVPTFWAPVFSHSF
jgi:hypothetical protein